MPSQDEEEVDGVSSHATFRFIRNSVRCGTEHTITSTMRHVQVLWSNNTSSVGDAAMNNCLHQKKKTLGEMLWLDIWYFGSLIVHYKTLCLLNDVIGNPHSVRRQWQNAVTKKTYIIWSDSVIRNSATCGNEHNAYPSAVGTCQLGAFNIRLDVADIAIIRDRSRLVY